MKIADISVSRVHSFIRFIDNHLYIEDNGSKFGTMIRVDKPSKLLEAKNSAKSKPDGTPYMNSGIYQIGRTMLYLRLEPSRQERMKLTRPYHEEQEDQIHCYQRYKGTVFGSKIREKRTSNIDPVTHQIIMDDNMIPAEFIEAEEEPTFERFRRGSPLDTR
mmetsp:Transcript_18780/g.28914  ORF Transcript_18780/g.28914 Transcript_18780/m.28914 type:complete len:161 (+) Transcript_18780:2358-2840(+)